MCGPLEPAARPLPDPAGSEPLLLRLEAVSVTVAVCPRPPDDEGAHLVAHLVAGGLKAPTANS